MAVGSAGTGVAGFVEINAAQSTANAALIPQVVLDDPANGSIIRHLAGRDGIPTIAAGAQIGTNTSPSVAIVAGSTDLCGQIVVTTGSTPGTAGIIAAVTFALPHLTASYVFLFPATAVTAGFTLVSPLYATLIAAGAGFNVGLAVADAAQHVWTLNYLVLGA